MVINPEKKSKVKILTIFIAVIAIVSLFKACGDKNGNDTATTSNIEQSQEVKQETVKEDYGIKSTDLVKIKDINKNNNTITVSTINETKNEEKNLCFLAFEMATKDIIWQIKNSNADYKILIIKDYKGDKNLFTVTFSKDKINTIKPDVNFMEIMSYADKIDGYDEKD